jgi:hypothetical protein
MAPDSKEHTTTGGLPVEDALRILLEADPSSALWQRSRAVLDAGLEVAQPVPKSTALKQPKFLTIGMATYNDFDGCYFTVQAIRGYHAGILDNVEFLILDNNPTGPCAKPLKDLEGWIPNYRYFPHRSRQGTAVRDLIFREAAGEWVLCIDSHIFLAPGALERLIEYCRAHPGSTDLLQGPLLGDDYKVHATCFSSRWSHAMYGVWALHEEGRDIDAPPFEIEMQGLGLFACRRAAWPGFNPRLDGFGGEEGYIHEKIRRAGGRALCLPFLRWLHRFSRPNGLPYGAGQLDRIRNYSIIYEELGLDPAPMVAHFQEFWGAEKIRPDLETIQAELDSPLHFFDAIYCINLDRQPERWEATRERLRKLGMARGIRRLAAADTPLYPLAGKVLSHRRAVAEAKLEGLEHVLVFEDDVRFSEDAAEVLRKAVEELEWREWDLFLLGGYRSANSRQNSAGCRPLPLSGPPPHTHAIAYRHTMYDEILRNVPDNATDAALWLARNFSLGDFYASLNCATFCAFPAIAGADSLLEDETRSFEV